jgi:hypothetical protein
MYPCISPTAGFRFAASQPSVTVVDLPMSYAAMHQVSYTPEFKLIKMNTDPTSKIFH